MGRAGPGAESEGGARMILGEIVVGWLIPLGLLVVVATLVVMALLDGS